ncbi:flagellar hook-associated protein FlgK [Acetobacterium woodii]|uniref:Flagellar hook-associated protein 1 n=1 Tax=Acetobacterium woodii (strain ATCC 29683 / DSM 1030 / JCM 2381 / KCTC 1655 / WB1) TaxID=931626 RepID=H6LDT8_ACEWD|nr:flagellar hook-associated protein FlgK [Acetobacterium woodii]AFA49252.1 flagellar hook-associated protein 1 [Acetobacterium woodii DSM 1030]
MTATFLAYSVASRAMEASQASINIVGNNISNINTEGYTRQRVDIVSMTTSGMVEKYATPKVSTGIGAKAKGTTQLRDPYIDARYRTQNAENSRYETMVKGLTNLEDVFDEASNEALQGELSGFINNLQSLLQSPSSSDIAQVARSAAEKVTQMINMYGTQLDETRVEQTENLDVTVNSEFNTYVKNIAALNKQIQKEEIYGNTPNELYDHRNLLIDKLSGLTNVKVSMSPTDQISENLSIPHYRITIENPAGGDPITVVDNDKYAEMSLDSKTDPLNVQLSIIDTNGEKRTDANKLINDGKLKGYLDIINGKGSFADLALKENDAKGIYYYKEKIDIFAKQFATEFNKINSEVAGSDGVIGSDGEKNLFTDSSGSTTTNITARNLQVSTAWLNNPSYINTTKYPTLDPAPSGYVATPALGDNVLRMIQKMSDKIDFIDSDGNTILTGTFNEYMTSEVAEVGTAVELNTNFSKTAKNVFQTISDARDSVAGVSLNEEGVNLSAFQKVYNAAMRYFNVLDENLDNIINKMGV